MQTTQFHNDASTGFAARIIGGIRALFGGTHALTGAFAAACANELRAHRGLAILIVALSRLSRRQRSARLIEAAEVYRRQWATIGLADTLNRMAKRPALFRAVLRALDTPRRAAAEPFAKSLPFAHAA